MKIVTLPDGNAFRADHFDMIEVIQEDPPFIDPKCPGIRVVISSTARNDFYFEVLPTRTHQTVEDRLILARLYRDAILHAVCELNRVHDDDRYFIGTVVPGE